MILQLLEHKADSIDEAMPRKQNGFGNPKSFTAKSVNSKFNVEPVAKAAGSYPRNRRYGSTVTRTVIEDYDLNSTWVRWRKGLEYYYRTSWARLDTKNPDYDPGDPDSPEYIDLVVNSKLYQGTEGEYDVIFDGYRYATKNSDTANHYVIKRTVVDPKSLGVIKEVDNSELEYPDNKKQKEIWTTLEPNDQSFMLRNMVGERLTDGETEASLSWILTDQKHPAVFIGKADGSLPTTITVSVPKDQLESSQYIINNSGDFNALVGEIGYIKEVFLEANIDPSFRFIDGFGFTDFDGATGDYIRVDAEFSSSTSEFTILDQQTELPPTLIDIAELPALFKSEATYDIVGTYFYDKEIYQRFYGRQYLTAEVVESEVETVSFTILPFQIQSTKVVGDRVELTSAPFLGVLTLYAPIGSEATLVWSDFSFTKTGLDVTEDGDYYHADDRDDDGNPLPQWQLIDTEVDPWSTPVFNNGQGLVPATMYTCSCPNYSHAQLRVPQATEDGLTRKLNRQRRYPLPTAKGVDRFQEGALVEVGGMLQSWATRDFRMSYKQCKHTIAARFNERIKTKEPSEYPSIVSRQKFEEKLKDEIKEIPDEFRLSYTRGGITTLEIIFSMAEALNMDDAELAFVILNSKF